MPEQENSSETKTVRRRNPVDAAVLMAALALLVSLAALGVSIYEAQVLRGQQRAMSWPYVQVSSSYSNDGFGIYLSNKGAGPALMLGAQVTVEGAQVSDALTLLNKAIGPNVGADWGSVKTGSFSNVVLEPSEDLVLVEMPWNDVLRQAVTDGAVKDIDVAVCYCSILDECWLARLDEPSRRQQCSAPQVPYSP